MNNNNFFDKLVYISGWSMLILKKLPFIELPDQFMLIMQCKAKH